MLSAVLEQDALSEQDHSILNEEIKAQLDTTRKELDDLKNVLRPDEASYRALAQEEGIAFAREVSSNESMKKMQTCSKMMEGVMPGMPAMLQAPSSEGDNQHICDQ